ncbi:MAG: amylo-alpha-1,6-glucosidase [Bacteroidetes bacterium GWA2_31_9]|nr:MAG: amylo-alpha-1,6-glucosidase [Bacteroidetes bacterium GWA2_31_9]
MDCLQFDKSKLINLEYSLHRELIRSNRAGSYASMTIIGSNTRKYHGLLIVPLEHLDGGNHLLLSSFDETVIQRGAHFNLALHRYPGNQFEPRGHKYIRDFRTEPIPKLTYRVGGVVLTKELLLAEDEERILIKYTLVEAHSPTTLQFRPFLAFRNIHKLSKANMDADTRFYSVKNGMKMKLYYGYPNLFMQFSKTVEYVHVPNWYYNIEYHQEQNRGYEYQEDLMVPGYFEIPIKKGESIIFSAGTKEAVTQSLKQQFEKEIAKRIPRSDFHNCLKNSAQQFIVKKDDKTEIIAGFPWFGRWGRDTFISLPGLTLAIDDIKTCKSVIDTMASELNGPLFPNVGSNSNAAYNSVDAPMWFFWSIQQYVEHTGSIKKIWKEYGSKLKKVLKGFKEGTVYNIKMHENGLVYAGENGVALTWMDAVVNNKPVTPRIGYNVEINALWYNAICFSLQVAEYANDKQFIEEWSKVPILIKESFNRVFWNDKKGYLADYVNGDYTDWSVRPNQVFATSLPYTMIDDEKKKSILDVIEKELLTPKGLRTLAPSHKDYIGVYEGDQESRDLSYHQGTVWPWLIGHFVEGYLKLHEKSGVSFAEKIYNNFQEDMAYHGIGSISEIYDGDPPHRPKGAISQAWSVAEILRIRTLIDKFK